MMSLLTILAILITSAAISTSSAAEYGSASRVGEGIGPNTNPMKTVWKPNEAHCSVACELTAGCVSFRFGEKKCSLFNEQYAMDSGKLEATEGVSYYYYTKGKVSHRKTTPKPTTTTTSKPKPTTTSKPKPTTTTSVKTTTKKPNLTYKLMTKKAKFQDARNDCKNRGGKLACVYSQEINDKLKRQLIAVKKKEESTGAWIGLQSKGTGGTFEWENKSEIFYSEEKNKRRGFQTWYTGNPENYRSGFACVRILPRSFGISMGVWADEGENKCDSETEYYFCELPT